MVEAPTHYTVYEGEPRTIVGSGSEEEMLAISGALNIDYQTDLYRVRPVEFFKG